MSWYVARLEDDELLTIREVCIQADCMGRAVSLAANSCYAGEVITRMKRLRQ